MLPKWYKNYKELIEKSINTYLERYFKTEKNLGLDRLKEATLYSVKGGKRVRAVLALEFFLSFSNKSFEDIGEKDDIIGFCIAIELLHAYSLVHDDLPALDNDTLRRGEETTWSKYGETTAILVGDLLNSLSFKVLSKIGNNTIIKHFAQAVSLNGMLGGQVLDMYYENNQNKLSLENLIEVHNKKTGALIQVSILGGLILGNLELDKTNKKTKKQLEKYIEFGKKIGLAFQIKDDLLDVEGTVEETGKSVGGEEKGFVYFLGVEKTKKYLNDIIQECFEIIKPINSEKLDFLVDYVGTRKK